MGGPAAGAQTLPGMRSLAWGTSHLLSKDACGQLSGPDSLDIEGGLRSRVDHFGASADYRKLCQEFGTTAERVAAARDSLARVKGLARPARGKESSGVS